MSKIGTSQPFRLALAAVVISLPGQLSMAQISSPHVATFKIAGRIVDALSDAPLGQARVSLIDTKNRSRERFVITSENGAFEFGDLPPGKFTLLGAKRGYVRGAYNQHQQFSTAIVTGDGMSTDNLVLHLTPLAQILGRVLDESGDPVRNATLW